jgi:endonuclease YncB( thermonuclease family)
MKKLLFVLLFGVSPAFAESIDRVKDGDTVVIKDANPPKEFLQNIGRLNGIDSPESTPQHAKCKKEMTLGLKAKKFTQDFIAGKGELVILYFRDDKTKNGWDKYGRYLIAIEKDGVDLSEQLVREGLAVYYDGGTKEKDWCK